MFTERLVMPDPGLSKIVERLINDREFMELKDNDVSIGIFLMTTFKDMGFGGQIKVATELEKTLGYDVVIYIHDFFVSQNGYDDTEPYIYQMMLSIKPMIVGKENACIIKIDRDSEISVSPATVRRYGKDVRWYKDLYGEETDEKTERRHL